MKKLLIFILVVSVVFSVVACKGSSSETMTAKEILDKTNESYKDVKSMTLEMKMTTESDNEMIPKFDMKMTMDMIAEPLQFKANVESAFGNMEMYGADGKAYMQNPATKEWMVMSSEEANLPVSFDMSSQMTTVDEELAKKFNVSEKDGMYSLILEGDGEDLMESWTKMLGNPPAVGTTVKNLKIEYLIDKEKFLIEKVNFIGDFESDGMNNEKVNVKVNTEINITNLDSVEKIEIPKEALDSE